MSRTTRDLIQELDNAVTDEEASEHSTQTALVIGFDLECKMIFYDEPDRLDKLNAMVREGGIPLGLIKVAKIGDDLEFFSRPLNGYEKNPKIQRILSEVCTSAGMAVVSGQHGA